MKMTTLRLKDEIKEQLGLVHDVMKLYGLCNDVILNEEQMKSVKEQLEKQKDHKGNKIKIKEYFDIKTREVTVN